MARLIRGQGSLALLPRKASLCPCTLPESNLWGTQSLGDTGEWVKQPHQDSELGIGSWDWQLCQGPLTNSKKQDQMPLSTKHMRGSKGQGFFSGKESRS